MEGKSKTGLIVVIMLIVAIGLGVGGFFIGKNANKDKCETKTEEKKEEVVAPVRYVRMDADFAEVKLNDKYYKLELKDGNLYLDSKEVKSKSGLTSGVVYYVFKASDNKEYLVVGAHNYMGASVDYLVDSNGKLLKEISYEIPASGIDDDDELYIGGKIAPVEDYTDDYTFVNNGILYYPKFVERYNGEDAITKYGNGWLLAKVEYVKVEINNSEIKESNSGINEVFHVYTW